MNKRYLIEQCNRLKAIDKDENLLHNHQNDQWWLDHNEGHGFVLDMLVEYINDKEFLKKKELIKLLNREIRKASSIIKELDIKYSYFKNDEDMTPEDSYTYSYSDGICCEIMLLKDIIKRKRYISKNAYIPNKWV
ncbi:transporter [Clostridium peptidivorans]|uniref:transporter n=1 Tax=Clostridium peptidivorans TaxID=100174 RepID=UPI000BE319A6|nr:transporter [Clostridium peptidivorans]